MPIPGSVLGGVMPFGTSAVGNLFPNVGTVRILTATTDTTGQELHTFADSTVAGQHDLPCRRSPLIQIRPQNQESKESQAMQRYVANYQLNFQGFIAIDAATLATYEVKVDGVVYQIESVESDGNNVTTRLMISIINPVNP